MRFLFFFSLAITISQVCAIGAPSHRDAVAEASFTSLVSERKVESSEGTNQFNTARRYQTNTRFADMFRRQLMFSKSPTLTSANSVPITYEMRRIYSMNAPRYSLILNFLNRPGQIFSIGYDWGRDANQHLTKPSLFLGLTHGVNFTKSDALIFSIGKWFGGKTPESSCYATHTSETLCSLLEMSGMPVDNKSVMYLDVKYLFRF